MKREILLVRLLIAPYLQVLINGWRAFVEVIVVTVSTWVPLLLIQWRATGSLDEWCEYYSNILYSGHLIVLSISLFGAVLWAALLREQMVVGTIHKIAVALGIVGLLLVVFLFGENPALDNRLSDEYASVSEIVYWGFVSIQFVLGYVNRRVPKDIAESISASSDELVGKYKQMGGS